MTITDFFAIHDVLFTTENAIVAGLKLTLNPEIAADRLALWRDGELEKILALTARLKVAAGGLGDFFEGAPAGVAELVASLDDVETKINEALVIAKQVAKPKKKRVKASDPNQGDLYVDEHDPSADMDKIGDPG